MDINKAFQVLELSEQASVDEVEKKYDMWLRRHIANTRSGRQDTNIEQINEAYKTIQEQYRQLRKQNEPQKSPLAEKTEHFLQYYKLHLFAGILLVVILVYAAISVINYFEERAYESTLPPVDFRVMLYGEYREPDLDVLSDQIVEHSSQIQRINTSFNYVPEDPNRPDAYAYIQRAVAILAADKSEVYMVDRLNFENLMGNYGMYIQLDHIQDEIIRNLGEDRLLFGQTEEDTQDHLYGIDVSGLDMFDDVEPFNQSKIIGIRQGTENIDAALRWFQELSDND